MAVTRRLGRAPLAPFSVVIRDVDGEPVVVCNAPFLVDGTPMPTLYYLVDPALNQAISRLESDGAVRRFEAIVDPEALERAHGAYAAERDAAIDPDHVGPRPYGGVGGTRRNCRKKGKRRNAGGGKEAARFTHNVPTKKHRQRSGVCPYIKPLASRSAGSQSPSTACGHGTESPRSNTT